MNEVFHGVPTCSARCSRELVHAPKQGVPENLPSVGGSFREHVGSDERAEIVFAGESREREHLVTDKESLADEIARLRDAARPRDARTEAPEPDQRVLLFGCRLLRGLDGNARKSEWAIDWFLVEGNLRGWMWGRYPEDHFWLPLPPTPEEHHG